MVLFDCWAWEGQGHTPCRVSYRHVFERVGKLILLSPLPCEKSLPILEPNQLHFHKYNKIGTGVKIRILLSLFLSNIINKRIHTAESM